MENKEEMTLLGMRLKQLRELRGMTQEQLSIALGISQTHVSQVERGTRGLSRKALRNAATVLGSTAAYLMGEDVGESRESATIRKINQPRVESDLEPFNLAHKAVVRVLPKEFAACCGNGIDWGSVAVEYDYEYIISDLELNRHSPVIAMYVSGDSMMPDIEDGDIVIFTDNPSEIEYAPNGCIMLVNYDGRMIVRGVFKKIDKVVLKAWNKDYEDIELGPNDEFRISGRVLRVEKSKKPRSMI